MAGTLDGAGRARRAGAGRLLAGQRATPRTRVRGLYVSGTAWLSNGGPPTGRRVLPPGARRVRPSLRAGTPERRPGSTDPRFLPQHVRDWRDAGRLGPEDARAPPDWEQCLH